MPGPLDWLQRMLGGGDPEAEGAAQTSMAMQPNVLDYAQRVLSGQVAREGVLGQQRVPYDLNKPLRENLPQISDQAIDIAMGIGPGAIRNASNKLWPQISLDTTDAQLSRMYPLAGERVDSRLVRSDVPNLSSIESSFINPEELSGIRMVPMSYFEPGSAAVTPRVRGLAKEIQQSGELNPLIVGHDSSGPYIVEGGHRFDALQMLKAKAFPARVVLDLDELPDTLNQFSRAGPSIGGGGYTVSNKLTDLLKKLLGQ